jgi:hypothetical protein
MTFASALHKTRTSPSTATAAATSCCTVFQYLIADVYFSPFSTSFYIKTVTGEEIII